MNIYLFLLYTYLFIINLTAFCLMGTDKRKAVKRKWRIPEKTLFVLAIFGGSIGSLTGMKCFHHKTKHWYFKYGMPAILMLQLILCCLLIKIV